MKYKKSFYILFLIILSFSLLIGCTTQKVDASDIENTKLIDLDLSYKTNLLVHDITIEDMSDGAMVNGYIKNDGDKEIMVIEYKIYYLDSNNKSVGESDGFLMNSDAYNNYSSIKPNYDCKFTDVVPDDVLKSWDHKVSIEITKIRVAQL